MYLHARVNRLLLLLLLLLQLLLLMMMMTAVLPSPPPFSNRPLPHLELTPPPISFVMLLQQLEQQVSLVARTRFLRCKSVTLCRCGGRGCRARR